MKREKKHSHKIIVFTPENITERVVICLHVNAFCTAKHNSNAWFIKFENCEKRALRMRVFVHSVTLIRKVYPFCGIRFVDLANDQHLVPHGSIKIPRAQTCQHLPYSNSYKYTSKKYKKKQNKNPYIKQINVRL